MKISVIIPSYRRPQVLRQALQSLQGQSLPTFEVIVVDNASDPEVERMVHAVKETAKLPVRYVPEPRLGLHYARHAGVHATDAELLVFTDDDATFDCNWLQAYQDAFTCHPDMAAAGGPVRAMWEVPPPDWLLEYMGDPKEFGILSLTEPYDHFRLGPDGYFFGVNMAIRRDALFETGGFHPESFGDIWFGDGESGLRQKLRELGRLIGYVPGALVHHHIPPARMTAAYFCRRMANQEACELYTLFHTGLPHRLRLAEQAVRAALRHSTNWIAARLVQGQTDARALAIQIRAARTWARVQYLLRLIRSEEFRKLVLKEDWLAEAQATAPIARREHGGSPEGAVFDGCTGQ